MRAEPAYAPRHRARRPTTERSDNDVQKARRGATVLEAVAFAAQRILGARRWEDAAPEVLARLGSATGASRTYICENHLDDLGRAARSQRYEWVATGIRPLIDEPELQNEPWVESGSGRWAEILSGGEPVAGPVRSLLPAERPQLVDQGILSILIVPIFAGDGWWGTIGFDDCAAERTWHPEEIDALRAAAGTLGAGIERQRAEEGRIEAEARYRALVESIPAVTYLDDVTENRSVYVSPQVRDLLGFEPEDWLADVDFWRKRLHPEDEPGIWAQWRRCVDSALPFAAEYRMIRADGRVVWVSEQSTVIPDELGRPAAIQGVLLDITEAKRNEALLRDAEAKYRVLVEETPVVTFQEIVERSDAVETSILYISPQVEEMLGYPAARWLDPNFWRTILHPDDVEQVVRASLEASATGERYGQDYRVITPAGDEVWVHEESVLVSTDAEGRQTWQGIMLDVTEAKLAREKLQEAESRYRALVEHVPVLIYAESIDAKLEELYIGPQVTRMLGYAPEEWTSTRGFWAEHIHPEDRARVLQDSAEANASQQAYVTEYRFRTKDGRWAWLHDEAVMVRDGRGRPRYWQGCMIDITERKQAEAALANAEAKFRTLVEHIPAITYVEAMDGSMTDFYISPQVHAILGYTPQEWSQGEDFWISRVHPDDHDWVLAEDARTNATGDDVAMEYRFLAADGRYRWIRDEAVMVYDAKGEPSFWQGFLVDITERKRAEHALRASEERYRDLFENANDLIFTHDLGGLLMTMNVATERLLGFDRGELVGRDIASLVAPEHLATVQEMVARELAGNRPGSFEVEVVRQNGDRVPIELSIRLVKEDGRPVSVQTIARDVTERKRAERDLKHALEVEREAGERLRALDDMKNTFLQAVSHDLRTPLAAILGLAVTLGREDVDFQAPEFRELANRIARNARKLERLVTDLLDLDRLSRGIVEPALTRTELAPLLRRVVDENDQLHDRLVRVQAEPIVANVDAAKVERILENLLANTARHTPPGTSVWVRAELVTGGVLLTVEDDGAGVGEHDRSRIFEPFNQGGDAPQHSPGVGVGLTLVARFAELHHGRAWVDERPGGGASFRVFLPDPGAWSPGGEGRHGDIDPIEADTA